MLTGDAKETVEHIAAELGISWIRAECLPADKVEAVAALPSRPVMMLGDGVNGAPVLAAADVGVAMGTKGSTEASEAAGVVIMLDDLSRVARAVEIGQRSVKVALQSIWIGIIVSTGRMIIAAFGYIPARGRRPVPGTGGPGHDSQRAESAGAGEVDGFLSARWHRVRRCRRTRCSH